MGLILDSSVLIASERREQLISDLLTAVCATTGFEDMMLSAISVIELEHGVWRADTPERARQRRSYIDEIYASIPVQPFTKEMGQLAARIDAEARKTGAVILWPISRSESPRFTSATRSEPATCDTSG